MKTNNQRYGFISPDGTDPISEAPVSIVVVEKDTVSSSHGYDRCPCMHQGVVKSIHIDKFGHIKDIVLVQFLHGRREETLYCSGINGVIRKFDTWDDGVTCLNMFLSAYRAKKNRNSNL